MKQALNETHTTDENGNPTGGETTGTGIHVTWQNGPLGRDNDRKAPNGAFVEGVLQTALGRLEFYQTAGGGRFACSENATAIRCVQEALAACEERTARRVRAGTEGTHAPDNAPPPAATLTAGGDPLASSGAAISPPVVAGTEPTSAPVEGETEPA